MKTMQWIRCDDLNNEPPFTKVCIYDGGNTCWAQLIKIEKTSGGRKLIWNVLNKPDNYPNIEPTHYIKIEHPTT